MPTGAKPGMMLRIRLHPHRDDFADMPAADQSPGRLVVLARPLLRADLHDAFVLSGHVDHPPALAGRKSVSGFST